MNYEITGSYPSELSQSKLVVKALLLILSVVFIPAAYVFVAAVFIDKSLKRNLCQSENRNAHILVYAYVAIGLIYSSYKIISALYAAMILLCYYSYLIFNKSDKESIQKLKNIAMSLSMAVFIYGIFQYMNPGFSMPSKWVDAGEFNLNKRIYSTFFNPNVFGFYINLILIISLEKIDFKKINGNFFVFASGLTCLILTFSRSAWISLIAALLAVSLFNKKYLKHALVISAAIFAADYLLGAGRTSIANTAGDSSFLYRLEVWKTSIEIIKDNFVSGIGFGTLFKHVGNYSQVVSSKIEHSHNIYIQIFTETGMLGFSLFIALLYKAVSFFRHNLVGQDPHIITAFAVLTMTLIHGFVDSVPLTPQIMMILSIYAGAVHSYSKSIR